MSAPATTTSEKDALLTQSNAPKATPSKLVLYYQLTRLHKFPAGAILVVWPCIWALTMAAYSVDLPPRPLAIETFMYFLGGTLLHSAACVINDICDRDFDRQVERCKNRPIASGAVSVFEATVLLIVMVIGCLAMLATTNELAFKVGLIGIFPLHALYPLMKRWTNWPQAWLGLAMNWGLPTAWISVTHAINWTWIPLLFLGRSPGTIVYDTIYACQDRKDDVQAGVKSTAVLFGDYVKPILTLFAAFFIATLAYAGIANGQGPAYFLVTVGGTALHLAWQLITVNLENGADCWAKFQSNSHIGWILWAGMLLDYYLKVVA